MSYEDDETIKEILSMAKQHVRADMEIEFQKKLTAISQDVLEVNRSLSANLKALSSMLSELLESVKAFDRKQKRVLRVLKEVFGYGKKGKRKEEKRRSYVT